MKFHLLLIMIVLEVMLQPVLSFSQEKNTTPFSFISNSTTRGSIETDTIKGPKYEKAKAIYNKLAEARGDKRFQLPSFRLASGKKYMAFLEGDGLSIGLEETAYDICEKHGENAIAALIGHELTHFYEKHQWSRGFVQDFDDLEIGQKLKAINGYQKVNNETQADYLGGFLAYSAGYNVFQGMPQLYKELYNAYNLEDEMPGYPNLKDRIELAKRSVKKVNSLVEVFEIANLLTAMDRFSAARSLYKYILQEYQGREIYNNLGVLTVFEAMEYMSEEERKYRLPIELDLTLGAGTRSGFGQNEKDSIRVALLQEALGYFKNAISLDSDYAPGYLNMGCAYYLLGDSTRATFYAKTEALEKAEKNPNKYSETVKDVYTLLALLEIKAGRKEAAITMLKEVVIKAGTEIAKYNLRELKGEPHPKGKKGFSPGSDETIDGVEGGKKIYDWTRGGEGRFGKTENSFFDAMTIYVYKKNETIKKLKNSKIYKCEPIGEETSTLYFHITDQDYPLKSEFEEWEVGTEGKAIREIYGAASKVIKTPSGSLQIYPNVIFFMDAADKVMRWASYYKKVS